MFAFFCSRLHPIIKKTGWQACLAEPNDNIPMQIHGIQLDMGDRMQQRDPALG